MDDAGVYRSEDEVLIRCIYSDLSSEIVTESTAETTLEQEYLLNKDGLLEIHKFYKATTSTPKENVFAVFQVQQSKKTIRV